MVLLGLCMGNALEHKPSIYYAEVPSNNAQDNSVTLMVCYGDLPHALPSISIIRPRDPTSNMQQLSPWLGSFVTKIFAVVSLLQRGSRAVPPLRSTFPQRLRLCHQSHIRSISHA